MPGSQEVQVRMIADEAGAELDVQTGFCQTHKVGEIVLRFVKKTADGEKRNIVAWDTTSQGEIKGRFDDAGIRVGCIASPFGKTPLFAEHPIGMPYVTVAQSTDWAKIIADTCNFFGAPSVRIFTMYPPKGSNPDDHIGRAVEYLGPAIEVFKKQNVAALAEFEGNLVGRRAKQLLAIYAALGKPANFGLLFDPANTVSLPSDSDGVIDEWKSALAIIAGIHVKDLVKPKQPWPDDHVVESTLDGFCLPGQGDGAFRQLYQLLAADLPARTAFVNSLGIPLFTTDMEPHLDKGGQFGGFSGPEKAAEALQANVQLLSEAGMTPVLA